MIKHYFNQTAKRKTRLRAKLRRISDRPRLSVFRSNKYIYAQIIADQQGKTLAAVSEKELPAKAVKQSKIEKAHQLGRILAGKAKKKKIKKVYFDRGAYQFHGRVKALAQGAREGGLDF